MTTNFTQKNQIFALLAAAVFCQSCASSPRELSIVSDHDMAIKIEDEQGKIAERGAKPNEVVKLQFAIARIEAEGKVPMMIVNEAALQSYSDEAHPWKLSLKPISEWKPKETDEYVTREVNRLYQGLIETLTIARENKVADAISSMDQVIKKYPKLYPAYFVRAQLEVKAGQRTKAIQSLDAAINLSPGFKDAIALKAKLQGGQP